MASYLPPWASKVFFSTEEDGASTQVLVEKLEEVTSKWYELGLELRLSLKELDDIKSKPKRVPEQEKFKDMLTYWIQHGKPNTRTWGFLATAVEKSGNRALAERIKKRGDYKQGEEVTLELVDLSSLLYPLQPHWKRLSDKLRIPISEKERIDVQLSVETCLTEMLHKWILTGLATIEALVRGLESHSVANRRLANNIAKDVEVFELLKVSSDDPAEKESIEKQLENYIKKLQGKETNDAVDGDPEATSTTTTAKTKGVDTVDSDSESASTTMTAKAKAKGDAPVDGDPQAASTATTAKPKGDDTDDSDSETASMTTAAKAKEADSKELEEINLDEKNLEDLLGGSTTMEGTFFLNSLWIFLIYSAKLLREVIRKEAQQFVRDVPVDLDKKDVPKLVSLCTNHEKRLKNTPQHKAFPGLFFVLASSQVSLSDTRVEKSSSYHGKQWTEMTVQKWEFQPTLSEYEFVFANLQRSTFKPSGKDKVLYLKRGHSHEEEEKQDIKVYFETKKYHAANRLRELRNEFCHTEERRLSMSIDDYNDLVSEVEKCRKTLTDDEKSDQEFKEIEASSDLQKERKQLSKFNMGKWMDVGRELGLSEAVLEEVKADYMREGIDECMVQMLNHWLNMNYDDPERKPPTWSNLADAVKEACNPALAKIILERHPS